MAIKKKPEERKTEILDTAERIFVTKGYDKTSVEDILKALQLSKGGFYYYFQSKEEVLDSIIQRYTDRIIIAAQQVVDDPAMKAQEKLVRLLGAIKVTGEQSDEMLTQLHHPENRMMHLKSLLENVKILSPLFGKVARQGVEEGDFKMDFPEQIMEGLFMMASMWFDTGFFEADEEEQQKRMLAFVEMAEKSSGVARGSFLKEFM